MRDFDCYCHTCRRWFHHLGIASHRAFHRNRNQDCKITYSDNRTFTHEFSAIKSVAQRQAALLAVNSPPAEVL